MSRSGRVLRARAPARANLIGNPSDQYGGAVLACSVPLWARVTLRAAAATEIHAAGESLRVRGPKDLALAGDDFDLARSVLGRLEDLPACTIELETDVPRQSGLGGSTALQVALLAGLWEWMGRGWTRYELAETARAIERETLGVQCGYVDQYMCTFGGLRYVDLRGKARELPPDERPYATVEDLSQDAPAPPFLLAFTGVRHHSGRVHAPTRERWERGEGEVVRAYERMTAIAREGKAAFLRSDWRRLGELMNENHAIQQRLGGTGEVDDRLIEAARAAGAAGAKLAGAGHGGTIAALWTAEDDAPLREALRAQGAAALYPVEALPGVRIEEV